MAVLVYTGRPGVGKTLTLVDELLRLKDKHMKEGKPMFQVFGNVRNLSIPGLDVVDLAAYFKSGDFLKQYDVEGLEFSWLDENQLLQLQQNWMCFIPMGALVLLDEIQNLYPSSDRLLVSSKFEDVDFTYLFEKINGRFTRKTALDFLKLGPFRGVSVDDIPLGSRQFFEKHRHYGYNIFGTCQNPSQLGKFLRCVVQEIIYVKDGSAFGIQSLRHYKRTRGLDDQKIGEEWRWLGRARRKLLFSCYTSEFSDCVKITKTFSLKLTLVLLFVAGLFALLVFTIQRSSGIYSKIADKGVGAFFSSSNPQKEVPTSKPIPVVEAVKINDEKIEGKEAKLVGIRKGFLRYLVDNGFEFEYRGYLMVTAGNRKIYFLDLKACDSQGLCFNLRNSQELESFGLVVKPVNACFLLLRSPIDDVDFFVGCRRNEVDSQARLFVSGASSEPTSGTNLTNFSDAR